MANVAIRETSVTPDETGSTVRLVLADAPPPYESATMQLEFLVRVPAFGAPLLAHLQAEAVRSAMEALQSGGCGFAP